ncbi:MAG: elongation factor G [Acidimicrobiia bacterium]|nr:elongation factor G [Acidimicrobiia bacterium]
MNSYPTDKIRNVVLLGHSGAGKTSLVEALAFRAGITNRLGTVEEKNTVSDFDPEEHKRGASLSLSVVPIEWNGHKINMIDTPGYPDFIGDVHEAISVADLAIIVVSAVEGIQVDTLTHWRLAEAAGLPRMFFVNKMDKEHASFAKTITQLRSQFGDHVVPIEIPVGEQAEFHGVADLITDKAYLYDSGKAEITDVPPEIEEEEHRQHDELVESVVEHDDELLEKYLEGEVPTVERLEEAMTHEMIEGVFVPVAEGASSIPIGIDHLADLICELGPAPGAAGPVSVEAGGDLVEIPVDAGGDPLAYVFKTVADPYVGYISMFRVITGAISNDDHLVNSRSGTDERLHGLFVIRGSEHFEVPKLSAGDIGGVAKLNGTGTGDTLTPKNKPVIVPSATRPEPVLSFAIKPRTQGEEDKLANGLHRLLEEDPALLVERNDETHQTLLRGMGEAHLSIALEKLTRKFGVEVDTEEVRVPYRETVTRSAEAEGKHKKQSGGHGQFGVCYLRLAPLSRGDGFAFVNEIKGGSIPRQFIPAVEKGVAETMRDGGMHGFPVVDVQVTVYDGKYHSVDSSEMAFKMAGRLGFRAAMEQAGPIVLEPISKIEVRVPPEFQGDIMGDLSSRRGRVQGTEAETGGWQKINALVPTSEIMRYAIDLRSMTQGAGRFTSTHDHYEELPSHLADKVIAAAKAADD